MQEEVDSKASSQLSSDLQDKPFGKTQLINFCQNLDAESHSKQYLSWLTPALRTYLYSKIALQESDRLYIQAVRFQCGIDKQQDIKQAILAYEAAGRLGSLHGVCRWAQLTIEMTEDYERIMFLILKTAMEFVDNAQFSFIYYLETLKDHDASHLIRLQRLFDKYCKGVQLTYMKAFIGMIRDKQTNSMYELVKNEKYLPAAHLYLAYTAAQAYPDRSKQADQIDSSIGLCMSKRYYRAYTACAQHLAIRKQFQKGIRICEQAASYGDLNALKWFLAFKQFKINITDWQERSKIAKLRGSISIALNGVDIYDFVYEHNFLKSMWPDYNTQENDWIQNQLVTSMEKMPDRYTRFQSDYIIIVYYSPHRYTLQQQDDIIYDYFTKCQKVMNKRLAIFFLRKVRKRLLAVCPQEQRKAREISLNQAQIEFIKICRQTIDNTEYPTIMYRYGKSYQKGYGVPKDIGKAYMLYALGFEYYKNKTSSTEQILTMSCANFYCLYKAQQHFKTIQNSEQVAKLKKKIKQKYDDSPECEICQEMPKGVTIFDCWHMICKDCSKLLTEQGSTCPMCRGSLGIMIDLKYVL